MNVLGALKSLLTLAKVDKHAYEAVIWFIAEMATAKSPARAFLPLAERAVARMERKMEFEVMKKLGS